MKNLGVHLSWIVVKDFETAIEFYTKIAGFTLKEKSSEYKWAELSGPTGSILALTEEGGCSAFKAGSNAITSISVENIEEARKFFQSKDVNLIGDIMEIPGHVKIQTFSDKDGNIMQLVQVL